MDVNKNNFSEILKLAHLHDSWMDEAINLIASENRLSPAVNEVLKSDFSRPS